MKVITVSHERGDEYDVERCASALRKRWPDVTFRVERSGARQHDITLSGGTFGVREQVKLFAEGFMASASLWER